MVTSVVNAHATSVPVAGARSQMAALNTVAVAAAVHQRPGREVTAALYPHRQRGGDGNYAR